MTASREHWDSVYATRGETAVSWYQANAAASLALVDELGVTPAASVVDVGGGCSTLVDGLLARGFGDLTIVDISDAALDCVRKRLGDAAAARLHFVRADVTRWSPERTYDLWHDRAVFHFLVDAHDRDAYRSALAAAVPVGGGAIVATFAEDGPERCSGLPVRRYSANALIAEMHGLLAPVAMRRQEHRTPAGATQSFVFVAFRRT